MGSIGVDDEVLKRFNRGKSRYIGEISRVVSASEFIDYLLELQEKKK